jgi:hypothetical protein
MNRARHEFAKLGLLVGIVAASLAFTAQAQTLNELSYTGAWGNKSLSGTQGGSFGGIVAFITTPNNQMHVYYRGVDQHIHQRYPNGTGVWIDEDLTSETRAPLTDPYSYVTGFSVQNFQYVFYADVNDHIHQLLYNNSNWSDSDITAMGGGAISTSFCCLFAMTTTPNNQVHVYYGSTNSYGGPSMDLHQLFFNGSRWSDLDLTIAGGGSEMGFSPYGGTGSTISGVTIGNHQYVFYEDVNADIHEMYYNNVRWTDVNLDVTAGTTPGDFANLAALVIPGTQTIKLFYAAGYLSGNMIELTTTNNTSWSTLNLGELVFPSPQTVAFVTSPNNQLHVYYGGSVDCFSCDEDVFQLYFNGSYWTNEDLTTETQSSGATIASGMAGFAIGNSQYIFYFH